jgi:hypothetical protein
MPTTKMPKPVRKVPCEVLHVGAKGSLIGLGYASSEKEARELGIMDFKISKLVWLIVRKVGKRISTGRKRCPATLPALGSRCRSISNSRMAKKSRLMLMARGH